MLTPCTLLTTILLLFDVIKVIDATIFSACLVPRKLRASGAKPQRRRPENFGIELQCDLLQRKKRTRALAYALVRAAERRTPCEQQTDSTRHVRVLFAAGDTPHEVISHLLPTSDAPSEFRSSAQRQQLRRPCDVCVCVLQALPLPPRAAQRTAPRRWLMHDDRGVQRRGLPPGTARVPLVPRRASPARCSHLRLHESNDALVALMRSPATRPFVPGRAPLSLVALRHDGLPR